MDFLFVFSAISASNRGWQGPILPPAALALTRRVQTLVRLTEFSNMLEHIVDSYSVARDTTPTTFCDVGTTADGTRCHVWMCLGYSVHTGSGTGGGDDPPGTDPVV